MLAVSGYHEYMKFRAYVTQRLVEPSVVRFLAWRGDTAARLLSPRAAADPYALYDELRDAPLVRSRLGLWLTADHATAVSVLRDRRFSSSPAHQAGYVPPSYPDGDPRARLPTADLLTLDPPDHTRLRRLVSRAFSPPAIAALEPWIRERAAALLDSVDAAAGLDLVDAFALPLPIAVICRILGIPEADQAAFRKWGHAVATTLEPTLTQTSEVRSRRAELELTDYLRAHIDARRARPDASLLSQLVAVEEEGDRLSSDELVSTALLLLVAGFETTVNLIGNGVAALLAEPGRVSWRRLHDEPSLIAGAVEELLRYDSPVQMTSRTATEDVGFQGETVRRGQAVLVLIGGANRDPKVFDAPHQLQIERDAAASHLAFSQGIHRCLGLALARLEGRIALEELTRRYPTLALNGTPQRRPLIVLRGYETLPVRASAGA
jgi:cytochrome P450